MFTLSAYTFAAQVSYVLAYISYQFRPSSFRNMESYYALLSMLVRSHLSTASFDIKSNRVGIDLGLQWLATVLSQNSPMVCLQQDFSADSKDRYWRPQYVQNASVIVFPTTSQDVNYDLQATMETPLGAGYALVSRGPSLTGISSTTGSVIDLKSLNCTALISDFPNPLTRLATTVIMYI